MAATVLASAPRPTRIVTPPTSTSIAPAPASDRHRGALRRPRRAGAFAATSTTAGTNCNSFVSKCFAADSLNWRRQPNNCCGDNPWRRATAQTESPLATISATIRPLSSSLHFRRRPAPVKTSSRRTGSVIALCTVSILSLTVKTKPQIRTSSERWPQNNAYIQPDAGYDESGFLHAFDSNRDLICAAAAKVYVRGSRGSYDLVAANF